MNSKKVIFQLVAALFCAFILVGVNVFIFILFLMGVLQLIRIFRRYSYEEQQVAILVRGKESGDSNIFGRISPDSIIYNRYATIKKLYDRKVPINHGAISSIMIAQESIYQSFPKFVHNVLILTGVFGTIISLILALVGASSMLDNVTAGKGINVMLLGMNTALTTTATAIICFFFFTFFYQKLTDIQTHLFSTIENAVMMYIVPEFSFDTEVINYKTEQLIKDLRELIVKEMRDLIIDLKRGSSYIEDTLTGIDTYNTSSLKKFDMLINQQNSHIEKTEDLFNILESINVVLKDGFRLPN
jgi:hypothetical protein